MLLVGTPFLDMHSQEDPQELVDGSSYILIYIPTCSSLELVVSCVATHACFVTPSSITLDLI